MKKLLYTSVLFILLTSCRTLEKMVERGEYDNAIFYATEKLAGKKKKKTKHIQMLEEAFAKINSEDLKEISFLDAENNPDNWNKVIKIIDRIEYRQKRVDPFVPLISKDGYEGYFKFVDTYAIKKSALEGSASNYYEKGLIALKLADEKNEKRYARKAFEYFKNAESRIPGYKNADLLKIEALEKGRVVIKIEMLNTANVLIPNTFESRLMSMSISNMNTLWRTYTFNDSKVAADFHAIMDLKHLEVSREQEIINDHIDEKEIKDGWYFLKNKKGEFVLDTAGKKIKVEKFKTVTAFVTQIERRKEAIVNADLIYLTADKSITLERKPITVEAIFNDFSSSFRGDRRALCNHDINRVKNRPRPFPTDEDLILDASDNLKEVFKSELNRLSI